MDQREKDYLEQIEAFTEEFGRIQRDFVLERDGVRAVVRFIEEFSGSRPSFTPGDPVIDKGKAAAERAIIDLGVQYQRLCEADPPPEWEPFHRTLVRSIRLQLEGYQEMARVFEDSDLEHLRRGNALVREGMGLLEAGERLPSGGE